MKIIFISGQQGSGKTSVSKALIKEIENSAYIGGDSLAITNPWEFGDKINNLAIENAVSLTVNFLDAGFKNIFIVGLVKNQKELDRFLSQLNKNPEVLFVWLTAKNEIRKERKKQRNRDEADKKKHFDLIDKLIPNIKSIEIKNGKSIFIDTSSKIIEDVVKKIKSQI